MRQSSFSPRSIAALLALGLLVVVVPLARGGVDWPAEAGAALLACLAARAEGTTVFQGVGELRVKESDRLAAVAENLRRLGAEVFRTDLHGAIEVASDGVGIRLRTASGLSIWH